MYKNISDHFRELTGESLEINYSNLYQKFAKAVEQAEAEDLQKEFEYRSARTLSQRHIDVMKKIVAEELEREVERVNGSLPVSSVFEAYQIAKSASEDSPRDIGLSNLTKYLEMKWKRNRDASLNANDYLRMREHFDKNFPKSKAGSVIGTIGKKGYATLPMSDLMEIASRIHTQDDFDYEIIQAGLQGNNPQSKKARRFILALINEPFDPSKINKMIDETLGTESNGTIFDPSQEEIDQSVEQGFDKGTFDPSKITEEDIDQSIDKTLGGPGDFNTEEVEDSVNEGFDKNTLDLSNLFPDEMSKIMDKLNEDKKPTVASIRACFKR